MGFPMRQQPNSSGFPKRQVPDMTNQIKLPAKSPAQELVDDVLSNPAAYSELRQRGIAVTAPREFKGQPWVANQDGPCQKPVGWQYDDAGNIRERPCGAMITQGSRCWKQGWRIYGIGCHAKGIERLSKLFIGEHLSNHQEFVNNLPDRRKWLVIIERLWEQEVNAGALQGAWEAGEENAERKTSRKLIEARILHAMRVLKSGVKLPEKPGKAKVTIKPRKAAPPAKPIELTPIVLSDMTKQEKAAKKAKGDGLVIIPAKPAQTEPTAVPGKLPGVVVAAYSGPDARTKAEAEAKKHQVAKGMLPFVTHQDGDRWVVINLNARPLSAGQKV